MYFYIIQHCIIHSCTVDYFTVQLYTMSYRLALTAAECMGYQYEMFMLAILNNIRSDKSCDAQHCTNSIDQTSLTLCS